MALEDALTRGSVILTQGGSGAWDEGKVGPLSVIKMAASDYRMWYEGINIGFTIASVGYATSSDGTTWSKSGSNPIFTATETWENGEVCPGTVIWDQDASLFKMWYHGGFNSLPRKVGYATSANGTSWTRGNSSLPVLSPGSAGQWDESTVADVCVIKMGAADYRMWYFGKNASNVQGVGYATSTDGVSWTKYGSNPVFLIGTVPAWDDGNFFGLFVIRDLPGSTFHAWYVGDDGNLADATKTGIGYARSNDGITWVRGPKNPVLVGTLSPEEWVSDPVFMYRDNSTLRVVFFYDDFGAAPVERSHREATLAIPNLDPLTFYQYPKPILRTVAR